MKILFTGASSFTGYWMVTALQRAGHEVVAPLRGTEQGYAGIKARRVAGLAGLCRRHFGVRFGDTAFLRLIEQDGPFDVFCHHAAEVGNYRSLDFDALAAVGANVNGFMPVLRALKSQRCARLVLTGTVFEPDEGAGPGPARAFSPYGLSKGLTATFVRYYAWREGISLGKFVIPNPFGPLEEPRFIFYLAKSWLAGQTPSVKTPAYVRDNIPVDLLALAYQRMVETLPADGSFVRVGPSCYVESIGAFAQRVATEMEKRLGVKCPLRLEKQTDFSEPLVRVNQDRIDGASLGWDEAAAWDALARYYRPA